VETVSRHWKEKLDPDKHRDFMSTTYIGGVSVENEGDNLVPKWVFFVAVAGFTFQFASLEQIQVCIDWFAEKIHPSSRTPDITREHYWQHWYERLPQWLFEEPKRQKVIKALRTALQDFEKE
jgi:hypothetical protein